MKITNIDWDTDDEIIDDLPTEDIPDKNIFNYIIDDISDYLSDKYKFCIRNYNIELFHPAEITPTMSIEDIKKNKTENNIITGNVSIPLTDIIHGDIETFLDALSNALTGTTLLMDISYAPIEVSDDNIIFQVSGDVSMILDEE